VIKMRRTRIRNRQRRGNQNLDLNRFKRGPDVPELVTIKTPGIPDRLRVWLKYTARVTLNPTVQGVYVWRSNSVFDPDFTGAGGQPRYFDQWAAMYSNYCVLDCHARTTMMNASTTIPYEFGTGFSDVDPTGTTFLNLIELRYGRERGVVSTAVGGPAGKRVYDQMTTRVQHGKASDQAVLDTDALNSSVTGNPADPGFFFVTISSQDAASNPVAYIQIELLYFVEFYGPQLIGASLTREPTYVVDDDGDEKSVVILENDGQIISDSLSVHSCVGKTRLQQVKEDNSRRVHGVATYTRFGDKLVKVLGPT
jgi:hypothetical protein